MMKKKLNYIWNWLESGNLIYFNLNDKNFVLFSFLSDFYSEIDFLDFYVIYNIFIKMFFKNCQNRSDW